MSRVYVLLDLLNEETESAIHSLRSIGKASVVDALESGPPHVLLMIDAPGPANCGEPPYLLS